VHWLSGLPPIRLGPFGLIPAWQSSFAVVGLPGLLLAALALTIRDPQRTEILSEPAANSGGNSTSLYDVLRYIARHWRGFAILAIGTAALSTLSTLNVWNVALFQRIWNWNVAQVGRAVGVLFLIAVPLGTMIGLWITKKGVLIGRRDAILRALLGGLSLAVPGFALYALMPSASLAICVLFVGFIGQAAVSAAAPAALMLITPGQMRSQTVAIFYLTISLVSLLCGPPPVGWMVDLMGDPRSLSYAIAIEAAVVGIPSLIILMLGRRHYAGAVLGEPGSAA
jgi:MFS family permease